MKTRTTNLLVLPTVAIMVFCAGPTILPTDVAAQEGQSAKPSDEVVAGAGKEEDPDAWIAQLSTPGPEHQRLNALAGNWDLALKLWASPDDKPVELKGVATREWMLEGLFLREQAEHPNEHIKAQVFRYIAYFGYNRMTGLYEHIWMSNESSGMYIEKGRYDVVSKVIRTSGKYTDAGTGFVILTRTEIAIVGPDSHTLTGYSTPENGREFKEIEIQYTRKR